MGLSRQDDLKAIQRDYLSQILADFKLIDADSPNVPGVDLLEMLRKGPRDFKLYGENADKHAALAAKPNEELIQIINESLKGKEWGEIQDPERMTADGHLQLEEFLEILIKTGEESLKSGEINMKDITPDDLAAANRFAAVVGLQDNAEAIANLAALNTGLNMYYGGPASFLFDDTFKIAIEDSDVAPTQDDTNHLMAFAELFDIWDKTTPEQGVNVVKFMRELAEKQSEHKSPNLNFLSNIIKQLDDDGVAKLFEKMYSEGMGINLTEAMKDHTITRDELPVIVAGAGKKALESGAITKEDLTPQDIMNARIFLSSTGTVHDEEMVTNLAASNVKLGEFFDYFSKALSLVIENIPKPNDMPQRKLDMPPATNGMKI